MPEASEVDIKDVARVEDRALFVYRAALVAARATDADCSSVISAACWLAAAGFGEAISVAPDDPKTLAVRDKFMDLILSLLGENGVEAYDVNDGNIREAKDVPVQRDEQPRAVAPR